ncbi:hypothetical protein [Nonomuraea angiospora]|uniref:hypothetical protein n=1 Tax=Nonomuraea angiospora TaxID=46172 RepID=UPI0029A54BC3|nr:hypothetical protein [Nonomuraea angiospora]MDX3104972.1 hypothetical protein [Nonomuraea angiospora]
MADLRAAGHAAAFLAVQRLRRRLALLPHLYAKIAGQSKPVYCDLDSPPLVRSLTGAVILRCRTCRGWPRSIGGGCLRRCGRHATGERRRS